MSTPTMGQALGLSRPGQARTQATAFPSGNVKEQSTADGHVIQILQAPSAFGATVAVDGRAVIKDNDDSFVTIKGTYRGGGRTYALIEENTGGNACEAMFQAIDLSASAPVVSPKFGNCSSIPTVSVAGGALRVAMLEYRAAGPVVFTFANGRLSNRSGR